MSDNQNGQGGMDEIDGDPAENMIQDPDAPQGADAFAAAAQQAAAAGPETPAEKQPEPKVEIEGLWDEVDQPNPHVTHNASMFHRQALAPTQVGLAALHVGMRELDMIMEARGLNNLTEEKAKSLSNADRRMVNLARNLTTIYQDIYFDDVDKAGNWHATVMHNETALGAGKVKAANIKDPVLAIRATFGQGSQVQIPLWSTGLWVTFRAPTIQELLDFEQKCRLEKMNLGRSSNGMVFSAVEVYTVETYMRFALEHVISVNYAFETADHVEELLTVIRSRDYQQVVWGMVCAMYPDGYPLRQPCVANPDTCDHLDEVLLNFARMGFVDRDKISDKQALMMASRSTKRDRKWLEEYQAEFPFFEKRINVGNGLTAVLRCSSLAEQIDAGHLWVDGISKATNEAFGARLSEMDRIRHIMRSGALTNLRQYGHWVAQFEHKTDPEAAPIIHADFENKDRILELLSEDPQVSEMLTNEIVEWIKKSTVSYTALAKTPCPACQKEPEDKTHPHLIPIDIGYVFFTLAALKISQVEGAAV
ncbi:putative baseplate hub assembly protein [Pseudomonas phage pPa_SNUABM_DT01]|nr:putative baseplate hub assembly protein [Pseudomonas phage pPa_SNUABM_DT01]